jgi:hypothetical protein
MLGWLGGQERASRSKGAVLLLCHVLSDSLLRAYVCTLTAAISTQSVAAHSVRY